MTSAIPASCQGIFPAAGPVAPVANSFTIVAVISSWVFFALPRVRGNAPSWRRARSRTATACCFGNAGAMARNHYIEIKLQDLVHGVHNVGPVAFHRRN